MVLDDVLTIENERNFGEPSMTKPLENEQQQLEDISNDQKLANEIGKWLSALGATTGFTVHAKELNQNSL
eukprot:gene8950-16583_t